MKEFPPPNSLFVGLPAGIRGVLLTRTAQAIESGTDPFSGPNLTELSPTVRLDYIVNSIETGRKLSLPYRQAAQEIDERLQEYLSKAQELEKSGDAQTAIKFYETCIESGFLGSLPYERLRILYTKQGHYQKAIRACERYIEILKMVKELWPQYPNIRQIPKYQEAIKKLSTKV